MRQGNNGTGAQWDGGAVAFGHTGAGSIEAAAKL